MNARVTEYLPGAEETRAEGDVIPFPTPRAVSLGSLQRPITNDPNELLRDRFLCRGGGMLLVGPTGVGKSSLSMQFMLQWALGRCAFGIAPTGPLKSLLIQAENDDGDLAEMRDGVVKGLELLEAQWTEAFERIKVVREDMRTGDDFARTVLRPLLEGNRPDIVWIDPALAYLGGESNDQDVVGKFLRNGLNPLLREFNCAGIIVHHTNKPPGKNDAKGWTGTDQAYLGGGSAEWANWPRAVIALKKTPEHGIFELCVGKRGNRLNWRNADDSPAFSRHIAYAKGDGEIYWRLATDPEIESAHSGGASKGTADRGKVLMAVPTMGERIEKSELVRRCKLKDVGRDRTLSLIKELIRDRMIHEERVPRSNGPAQVFLAQGPGPETDAEAELVGDGSEPGCETTVPAVVPTSGEPKATAPAPTEKPSSSKAPAKPSTAEAPPWRARPAGEPPVPPAGLRDLPMAVRTPTGTGTAAVGGGRT